MSRAQTGKRLADAIYDAVVADIASGVLVDGTRLKEEELARQHGVSRTPVRETIQRLVLSGHATADGRGAIVTAPSNDDILDAFVLRETLEALASRLAAQRCTELDAARLRAVHDRFIAANRQGDIAFGKDLIMEFHERVWQISGNPVLHRTMSDLFQAYWLRVTPSTVTVAGRLAACADEHDAILSAIIRGDADAAEEAARRHIREARDNLIAMTLDGLGRS